MFITSTDNSHHSKQKTVAELSIIIHYMQTFCTSYATPHKQFFQYITADRQERNPYFKGVESANMNTLYQENFAVDNLFCDMM
jgi:hypothetical protein